MQKFKYKGQTIVASTKANAIHKIVAMSEDELLEVAGKIQIAMAKEFGLELIDGEVSKDHLYRKEDGIDIDNHYTISVNVNAGVHYSFMGRDKVLSIFKKLAQKISDNYGDDKTIGEIEEELVQDFTRYHYEFKVFIGEKDGKTFVSTNLYLVDDANHKIIGKENGISLQIPKGKNEMYLVFNKAMQSIRKMKNNYIYLDV